VKLEGKVAVITGGAGGIGMEIARRFAAEGARVAIADIDGAKAAAAAAELKGAGLAIAMDVTDEAQVNAGFSGIVKAWGGVDILVSNAGSYFLHFMDRMPFAEWRKMLSTHLDGAFLTTRACLQHMYGAKRGGTIIYMGSVYSKEASSGTAAYVTSKHGLAGLCKVVAREGARHNVRSYIICPGFVRTPAIESQFPVIARSFGISEDRVAKDVLLRSTVDGEFTTTAEVADVALFFATFESNALTGQSLYVSHGATM
jgi:3-hydroxybutyrate dehydrogenase